MQYPLWRVSHPFDEDVAVRLIWWFPPDSATVVAVLFGQMKLISRSPSSLVISSCGRAETPIPIPANRR
jgi:hypothetical protein